MFRREIDDTACMESVISIFVKWRTFGIKWRNLPNNSLYICSARRPKISVTNEMESQKRSNDWKKKDINADFCFETFRWSPRWFDWLSMTPIRSPDTLLTLLIFSELFWGYCHFWTSLFLDWKCPFEQISQVQRMHFKTFNE